MSVLPFVRGVDFTKNDFSVSKTSKNSCSLVVFSEWFRF